MKRDSHDNAIIATTRFLSELFCAAVLWAQWGWGVGLAAIAVIVLTGVPGDKRQTLVPVNGLARVSFEIAFVVLGVFASFALFGRGWGMIILVLHGIYILMSIRRFRWLIDRSSN